MPTDYEALRSRQEARVAAQAAPRPPLDYQAAIDGARRDAAARASRTRTDDAPLFSPGLHAAAIRHEKRIGRLGDRSEAGARARHRYQKVCAAIGQFRGEPMSNIANLPTVAPAADPHALMEAVILHGDLSKLSPRQRTDFYMSTCQSLGLNPLTRPFDYIRLNGKEVLYAKRDAADQLRAIRHISLEVISETVADGMITVRVRATAPDGRTDSDIGAVPVVYPDTYKDRGGNWVRHPKAGQKMTGEDLANALMKATTKAKRRVTLSLCGLGFLDETEVASVLEAEAQLAHAVAPPPRETLPLVLADGSIKHFPKTKKAEGIPALLDFVALEVAHEGPAILMEPDNIRLLDNIATLDCFRQRVADIRAAGNRALLPEPAPADDLTDEALGIPDFDPDTGEVTEPDPLTQKMAERRGAAPPPDDDLPPA